MKKLLVSVFFLASAACGGAVTAGDSPNVCDVAGDGAASGAKVCGADGVFSWSDAGVPCDQAACPTGQACDYHAHAGTCL